MSKTFESPVKRWKGSITISDPLSLPQAIAWNEAIKNAGQYQQNYYVRDEQGNIKQEDGKNVFNKDFDNLTYLKYLHTLEPAILEIIEVWDIPALANKRLPASPGVSSAIFISKLMEEIGNLYDEAEEIPNA